MVADLTLLFDEAGLKNNSSTHLQIFCENDVMCDAYNGKTGLQIFNNMSDIAFDHVEKGLYLDKKGETLLIRYYPQDLEIRVEPATNDAVKVGRVENSTYKDLEGIERYERRYQLIPLREKKAEPEDINIWWRLPGSQWSADRKTTARWTWTYKTYEPEITLKNATIAYDQTINGGWSRLNTNGDGSLQSITLGDGEELMFHFGVKNENAEGSVENVWLDEGIWGVGKGNKVKTNDATDKMDPSTWLSRRKTNGDYPDGFNDNGWLGSISNPHYDHWNKLPESKAELKKLKHLYCVAAEDDPGSWRIGHGWDFYVPDEFVYKYYFNGNDTYRGSNGMLRLVRTRDIENIEYFEVVKDLLIDYTSVGNLSMPGGGNGDHYDPVGLKNNAYTTLNTTYTKTGLVWAHTNGDSCNDDRYFPYFYANGINRSVNYHFFGILAGKNGGSRSDPLPVSSAIQYYNDTSWVDYMKYFEDVSYPDTSKSEGFWTRFHLESIHYKGTNVVKVGGCQSNLQYEDYDYWTYNDFWQDNYGFRVRYEDNKERTLLPREFVFSNPNMTAQIDLGGERDDTVFGRNGYTRIIDIDDDDPNEELFITESIVHPFLKPAVKKYENNTSIYTCGAFLHIVYNRDEELICSIELNIHPDIKANEKGKWLKKGENFHLKAK